MTQPNVFQEGLPLRETGRFRSEIDAASLDFDPELLELLLAEGPLCFLDFEATGLDPTSDVLIEVGAALVRPGTRAVEIFNSFIRTDRILSPFIRRLTGIRQEDVDCAPPQAEVATELDRFIGEVPVVAHNATFERTWLTRAIHARFEDHPFLDTVELLALVYPDARNMKLDTFCREKLGRGERHRALDDALDTLRMAVNVFAEAREGSPAAANARRALERFHPSSPWLGRLRRAPSSRVDRRPVEPARHPAGEPPPPVPFDLEAIAERLEQVEIAERVIPGYRYRPEQRRLLEHVFDCFTGADGKTVRICEAGTGIGKTLAYLAVAVPFARETGAQVIVSTSSKLLQRQLIEKDIPAAAWLTGHGDLRYTLMKGRANYLCRARLDRFLDQSAAQLPPPDSFPLALIAAFARSAGHGEVDRIPGVLYQLYPELERCRREATSGDATECSRDTCERTAGTCVFRQARRRLESAEIIVVNHDLLLRWPPDYPPLTHLVIDEVHELAERADAAYARTADGIEIRHRLEAIADESSGDLLRDPRIAALARRGLELVPQVGAEARAIVGSDPGTYRDELAIPMDGPGPAWGGLLECCGELAETLAELGRRLADAADSDEDPATGASEVLTDAASIIRSSLPVPDEDYVVRFRGLARRSDDQWRLVATPVSPAADFQFEILDRVQTLFGTSATVSVADDARGALGSLEIDERAGDRYQLEPPVESPFDYANNLEVVFIDEPTRRERLVDNTVEVLATLAEHLGGSTMGLFTSRDRLSTAADLLDRRLSPHGIMVIAPSSGNADPHDLVRTFCEQENAVLLGARAFWQGIDVPGDACRAVVIEKLPFDVPGDPLIQRRTELIERAGGSGFYDYSMPRMLLRLKQMVGRLIRTPTDRGMVVIVEARCDRAYFGRLQEALPPKAATRKARLADLQEVVQAFFGTPG